MEYYDIILTDIQFHVVKPNKPLSFLRQIMKSFRKGGAPGRVYHTGIKTNEDGTLRINIPLSKDLKEEMEFARRIGKTPRFFVPKNGIPMYLGKDAIERLDADKEKLINKV